MSKKLFSHKVMNNADVALFLHVTCYSLLTNRLSSSRSFILNCLQLQAPKFGVLALFLHICTCPFSLTEADGKCWLCGWLHIRIFCFFGTVHKTEENNAIGQSH